MDLALTKIKQVFRRPSSGGDGGPRKVKVSSLLHSLCCMIFDNNRVYLMYLPPRVRVREKL